MNGDTFWVLPEYDGRWCVGVSNESVQSHVIIRTGIISQEEADVLAARLNAALEPLPPTEKPEEVTLLRYTTRGMVDTPSVVLYVGDRRFYYGPGPDLEWLIAKMCDRNVNVRKAEYGHFPVGPTGSYVPESLAELDRALAEGKSRDRLARVKQLEEELAKLKAEAPKEKRHAIIYPVVGHDYDLRVEPEGEEHWVGRLRKGRNSTDGELLYSTPMLTDPIGAYRMVRDALYARIEKDREVLDKPDPRLAWVGKRVRAKASRQCATVVRVSETPGRVVIRWDGIDQQEWDNLADDYELLPEAQPAPPDDGFRVGRKVRGKIAGDMEAVVVKVLDEKRVLVRWTRADHDWYVGKENEQDKAVLHLLPEEPEPKYEVEYVHRPDNSFGVRAVVRKDGVPKYTVDHTIYAEATRLAREWIERDKANRRGE